MCGDVNGFYESGILLGRMESMNELLAELKPCYGQMPH